MSVDNKRVLPSGEADPFYSDENIERLKQSIAQMETTGEDAQTAQTEQAGINRLTLKEYVDINVCQAIQLMKDESRIETLLQTAKTLMETMGWTASQAMEKMGVSDRERAALKDLGLSD